MAKEKKQGLSVFEYQSHMEYIRDFITSKGHGYKAAVAKAVDCQSAYVSRVLNDQASFSLEQAERISNLFLHTDLESRYFLTLVQRDRASTSELKTYFNKALAALIEERLNLKGRVRAPTEITENDRHTYYSSWIYGAVYVMTSIREFQDAAVIAKQLSLPVKKIIKVLEFLMSIGLVKQEGGRYVIAGGTLHLGNDSPHITRHHLNWRTRALAAVELNKPEELHYSLVMSISNKDREIVRGKIVDLIEEINKMLAPSKEEDVQVLCVDLFGLIEKG